MSDKREQDARDSAPSQSTDLYVYMSNDTRICIPGAGNGYEITEDGTLVIAATESRGVMCIPASKYRSVGVDPAPAGWLQREHDTIKPERWH